MARGAPIGNKFWQVRSKHGRDKIFKTPEAMWEAACGYFEWCDENPLMSSEAKVISQGMGAGSTAELIQVPKLRAYTLEGLTAFLHVNLQYFGDFKKSLAGKTDKQSIDFSLVIDQIDSIIRRQKFEGAAAGLLNATIISRDLGLRDKQEIEHTVVDVSQTKFQIKRRKKS